MNQAQAKVISSLSLALGLLGFIFAVCISQGVPLPGERPVRVGHTDIVPVDTPVNIETNQELPTCNGESCNLLDLSESPSPKVIEVEKLVIKGKVSPGAARRRPAPVSKGAPKGTRVDRSSVEVPGGAVWATDEALEYDPMNGEL